jgi:hypothetical protein
MVTFTPPPLSGDHISATVDEVAVATLGSTKTPDMLELVMAAELELPHWPSVTSAGLVIVPDRERVRLERVLETIANTFAVFEEASRILSSSMPSVAFRPHNDQSRAWLESAKGIHGLGHVPHFGGIVAPISFGDASSHGALEDRHDGVALLAEAHSQQHALGRNRDLIRFFERAFALPPSKLEGPLTTFLDPRYGYSSGEIRSWIAVRDPATHADMRKDFALEPDAQPLLDRMQQAGRDVLMNKAAWHDPSPTRRAAWEPQAWTTSTDGDGEARKGARVRTTARMFDAFGAFRFDFRNLTTMPDEWWCPMVTPSTAKSHFRVLDEP